MSTERDELANVIFEQDMCQHKGDAREAAAAILAAGYRKPQQVTTIEELDALPIESVVRSLADYVWEKFSYADGIVCWRTPGSKAPTAALTISLPATVLHIGGAE